jgi:hypothetical protein
MAVIALNVKDYEVIDGAGVSINPINIGERLLI